MSSPFDLNQTGADHMRERQREKLLGWAERVFAEPKPDGNGINPRLYELGYVSSEQETVLYKDLHSRDSEVGLGLLDWRKAELIDSIAYLKASIKKREHAAALARSRREALERLASSAQVAEGYYTQPLAELDGEMARIEMELTFLRAHGSKIDALERLIKLVGSESNLRVTRSSEQILRLFSQSWRGLVKIKSWLNHFEESAHMPALQPYKQPGEPAGYLLPLGDTMRAVAISRETAGYLLHMLVAINGLAESYREQVMAGSTLETSEWQTSHMLLRAIIELFYFCNFEMPFSYIDLAVDPEDPSQLWVYDYEAGSWLVMNEDTNSSRTLKRVGAEAAQLLINGSALLKCRRDDDLSAIIEEAAPQLSSPGEAHNYRLFMCSGLSEFDLDPASQRIKFRMAFSSMRQLLQAISVGQPSLTLVTNSLLGGPLETILGMALLDSRAFSFPDGMRGQDPIARFQSLSFFWRTLGRRRAIAMLGEDYVKQVTNGLQSLGEQGPDHPTFLTMRAGTVFGLGAAKQTGGAGTVAPSVAAPVESAPAVQAISPFMSLGLSDQIRLLDLTVMTWKMAEELLEKLREVHSQGKLKRILEGLPALVSGKKEDIQIRFNTKWLMANNWYWTFLRNCTPVAWDFWTKLSSNEDWDAMLLKLPPYQALGLLLRLFCDVIRMLLIIELSGAEVAESLPVESESAGQAVITGLEGFFAEGERLPPHVAETINFYYDPEVRFDSWLAFTSSYRRFLAELGRDLKLLNVDAELPASIEALIAQIEILYPVREAQIEERPPVEVISEPEANISALVIDESEALRIDYVLTKVLETSEQDIWTFLKLLSLAARTEKRGLLALAAANSNVINDLLPSTRHRSLLFNMPVPARKFFNFLTGLGSQGSPAPDKLDELRPQLKDYFDQLEDLHTNLVSLTNQIPHLLPESRDRLSKYLAAAPRKGLGLNYLLLLVCNRLVIDIADFDEAPNVQAERAEASVRAYLRDQLQASIEEPSVEVYPIGGGRILVRRTQCIITTGGDTFEPLWSELNKTRSQALYGQFITNKLSLAIQMIGREFPSHQLLIK